MTKAVLTFVLLLGAETAFSKQIITCSNPKIQVTFDEKNLLDLKKTSYIESNLSLKGRITEVIATMESVTFIKTEVASSKLIIPREVHGRSIPYFQGIYSNVTESSAVPSQTIECSSVVR